MLLEIIKSFILGLVPEVLYFTFFIIYTKDIKEKRGLLGLFIGIIYFLCMFIQKYQYVYYFLFIILVYLILKRMYGTKTQIIDIFVIAISSLYLSLLSLTYFFFADYCNYYVLLLINRILIFAPFIFRNKFNILYEKYKIWWNRNDKEKRPIKSITLRIISLIIVNLLIVLINVTIINILNYIK